MASEKQVGGDHYRQMPIQPGEFIYRNKLGWHEGNAVKYICRHRLKGGKVDIDKAIHYLELLREIEYGKDVDEALPKQRTIVTTYKVKQSDKEE